MNPLVIQVNYLEPSYWTNLHGYEMLTDFGSKMIRMGKIQTEPNEVPFKSSRW